MSEPHDPSPGFHHVPRPEEGRRRVPPDPFPLEVLPGPVADMVRAVASSRCVAPDVPAAAALSACGSAIGLSRVAYDEYADWTEPPITWLAVVIRSGARKTIILDDLFAPHKARQQRAAEEFDGKLASYGQEYENWTHRKKKTKGDEVEPKPKAPQLEHIYTSDCTPEALIIVLKDTPRGVLVYVDELAYFFGGFGAYSKNADRDRAFYLALFRGIQFKGDRKGTGTTFVPQAAASIVGGVQLGILARCFDMAAYLSGLASRFLIVDAPPQVKEYRRGPTAEQKARYAEFIDKLFNLNLDPFSRADGGVGYRPLQVGFSDEARELLRDFVPDWSEQSLIESADIEAAMSKLEGYAIRFALILRVCREAMGEARPEDPISREDLSSGIRLARWFKNRALAVYEDLKADEAATGRSTLLARAEVIRTRFGGAVTVREWQKLNTRRSMEEAKAQLDELVAAEMAVWRQRPPGPQGGQPTQECALIEPRPGDEEGEVPGCGLRVAWEELRDENGPHGAEDGGDGEGSQDPCNPQPPQPSPEGPSPYYGEVDGWGDEVEGEGVPRGPLVFSIPDFLPEGTGEPLARHEQPPATRNPQPTTPPERPRKAVFPTGCRGPQPTTPRRGSRVRVRALAAGSSNPSEGGNV